jgi:phosphatidylglycerophosphate synthase
VTATTQVPAPTPGPVRLPETLRRLAAAQKGAHGAPLYSRFVNRPLGRLAAAVAFHAGLTPNLVTAMSAASTFGGLALLVLVRPSVPMGVAVTVCLVLGYALDAADGQLARLQGGGSPAGEWLDHMVDAAKVSGLHLAVAIGCFRFDTVDPGWLLVPLGFCLVDAVSYFATMLNEALRAQHGAATRAQRTPHRASIRRSLLTLPTDYGLLCCVFLLYGAPALFLPAYAVLFAAATAFLAVASIKWFQEMGRLSR